MRRKFPECGGVIFGHSHIPLFAQADDVLGFLLSDLCFNGPAETLNDTLNTQPALFVMGVALVRALSEALGDAFQPACAAGHSLGELTALTAAGAMPFEDGLRLVRERGRLMHEASQRAPGAMAAVLGLDTEALAGICAEASAQTGRPLVIANDNCPGQIVISGHKEACQRACEMAEKFGAMKAVPLAVAGAFHTKQMNPAAQKLAQALEQCEIRNPSLIKVIANIDAEYYKSSDSVRKGLTRQLIEPILRTESEDL